VIASSNWKVMQRKVDELPDDEELMKVISVLATSSVINAACVARGLTCQIEAMKQTVVCGWQLPTCIGLRFEIAVMV
jgi:hypothetical protein